MVEPSNIKIENCTIKSKRITFGEKICYLDKTSTYNTTMEFKKSLEKDINKEDLKNKQIEIKNNSENKLEESLNYEKIKQNVSIKKRR